MTKSILIAAALALTPAVATALPVPSTQSHTGFAYMDQLYSYPSVEILEDGTAQLRVMFSNSRNWEGTYTVGVTVEFMRDGEPIYASSHSHNTYVRHGTKEDWRIWVLDVPQEIIETADDIRFSHFMNRPNIPDGPMFSCADFFAAGGVCF